jgi:hypothetical protein
LLFLVFSLLVLFRGTLMYYIPPWKYKKNAWCWCTSGAHAALWTQWCKLQRNLLCFKMLIFSFILTLMNKCGFDMYLVNILHTTRSYSS